LSKRSTGVWNRTYCEYATLNNVFFKKPPVETFCCKPENVHSSYDSAIVGDIKNMLLICDVMTPKKKTFKELTRSIPQLNKLKISNNSGAVFYLFI
jgi:hypothetical protein